jgi:dimethylargininase
MGWTALTRLPGGSIVDCELENIEREPIDFDRVAVEHEGYRACLQELGLDVVCLPAEPELPDAVFVEDPLIVLDEVVILTRPGVASRRCEGESLRAAVPSRELRTIEAPATLEGGDVLRIGDVLHVSMGSRTNHAGLKQLAHLVLEFGYRVKAVTKRDCLHLKTACTYLGRDTLLANPRWVDLGRFEGLEVIEVDPAEPFAGNALSLAGLGADDDECWSIHSSAWTRTRARIEERGFRVHALDLAELAKAEAGPTCLSAIYRKQPGF